MAPVLASQLTWRWVLPWALLWVLEGNLLAQQWACRFAVALVGIGSGLSPAARRLKWTLALALVRALVTAWVLAAWAPT